MMVRRGMKLVGQSTSNATLVLFPISLLTICMVLIMKGGDPEWNKE